MKEAKKTKQALSAEAERVLKEAATEQPFTSELLHEKRSGLFACAGCGTQLFASDTKFDSGTGWPSFTKALPGAITYHEDHELGMKRTEVRCTKCGGHLGHVFDDGPASAGGKRYCINGCVLDFAARKP